MYVNTMSKGSYIIKSDQECGMWPKHMVESYSAMRSTLEEAQKYIDDAVEEFRKSWSIMKVIK